MRSDMNWAAVLGLAATLAMSAAVRAEGENIGDRQQCIPTGWIDSTIVIDNRTILVEMRGKGYKRIDLANNCSGLKLHGGFSYSTSTNDLCTSNTLRVVESGGAGSICMVREITTIDEQEAKALRAER
jgi:hypothetical protein